MPEGLEGRVADAALSNEVVPATGVAAASPRPTHEEYSADEVLDSQCRSIDPQQFRMQDKDVLYVANAGSVALSKFLSMVNGISDTSAAVPANLVKTRDSVEALVN